MKRLFATIVLSLFASALPTYAQSQGESVGAMGGTFSVSPMGGATYTIPIQVPQGVGGMEPQLSIVYNSQAGNGLCGYGTNLAGFSSITRAPKDYSRDGAARGIGYGADDALYLDGVRLIHMSGTEGQQGATYSPESDPFTTVITYGSCTSNLNNIWFEVHSSNGMVYWYGAQLSYIKGSSQRIHSWYLSRAIQPTGNYIEYIYDETDNYMYPTCIVYGSNTHNQQNAVSDSIKFFYESRTDSIPIRFDGKKGTINKRLKTIMCKTNDDVFRTYTLNYNDTGDETGKKYSRLTSITETNSENNPYPATQLNWSYLPTLSCCSTEFTINPPSNLKDGATMTFADQTFLSGDLNGDGLCDIIGFANEKANASNDHNTYTYTYLYVYYASKNYNNEIEYTSGQSFRMPPTVLSMEKMQGAMNAMSVIDLEGDGINELIMPFYSNTGHDDATIWFFILGQNYAYDDDDMIAYGIGLRGNEMPLFSSGDTDNDGKCDIIIVETAKSNGKYPAKLFKYNPNYLHGNHSLEHAILGDETNLSLSLPSKPKQVYLTDMNGNGLSDLLILHGTGYKIFWNQGQGSSPYADNSSTAGTFSGNIWMRTAGDFNGDGLLDLLTNEVNKREWYFRINNGDGTFTSQLACNLYIYDQDFTSDDDGRFHCQVIDFDGDGMDDVIVTKAMYEETWFGLSFEFDETRTKWMRSTGNELIQSYSATSNKEDDACPTKYIIGDFDGDGRIEMINYGYDCLNWNDANGGPYWFMYKNNGLSEQTGKVTSISGNFGSTTGITYSFLTDSCIYTPGNACTYPAPNLTIPLNVVERVVTDNGAAGNDTTAYQYEGFKIHRLGRGVLGFTKTKAINTSCNTIVESGVNAWHTGYRSPSSTYTKTIVNNAESIQTTSIELHNTSPNIYYTYPSQTIATNLDGNTVTTQTEYDTASGNITLERTYYGTGTGIYTQTQYQNYTTHLPGRSNKPQRVVMTRQYPGDNPFVTIKEYLYDMNGQIIQSIDNAQSQSLQLTTDYTYDVWGNLTSETVSGTGAPAITTFYSYDSTHRFPVRIYTNPSSTVQKYSYDLWGNILSEQDSINPGIENLITHTYDGWGNRVRTQIPGSGEVTYAKGWGSSSAQRFYTMEQGTARPWVRTWYDSRGREVMTESIGADDMPVSSVMAYDGKGQRISETETTGNLTLTHYYEYDDRGRLMRETHPGGNVIEYTYSLDGHSKIVSDNGRQTTYTYDAVGNLLEVQSPLSSSLAHTYSSNGGIKQTVTDGATWTVSYDECGNRISMTDPDAGTTTYAYDALGRERERIDGRGVVFLTNYDYLGRVTSMTAGNETTTYTYGTGGNGQMRLTSESNGCWTKSYTYDRYGRVNKETMTKIGDSYSRSMIYHYNASGLQSGKDYPDGKSVEYAYDAYGNCTTVNFEENKLLWRLTGNAGKTATSTVALFNSPTPYVRTTQLDNVGNLQSRIMTHGGTTLQNDSYVFDPQTGNLLSRTLTGHPTETFTYDALDRLTRATYPGQMAMDMNYLNNGNISTKTNMGLYSYNDTYKPHAVDYIEACSEVQDDYQYIDYNAWNKAEEIYNSLGGDGYTYEIEYGPDGQRVMSRMYKNGSLYCRKFYWGEYEEIHFYSNSETVRTYWVEAPDGLAGMFWTSTSDYYTVVHPNVAMTDHLGSLTGLYDYDGNKVFDASYDAWGKRTLSPNSFTFIARGYTGHEHLDELGLINMNGRMYDPRQGRFLSPDPFVQAPSNPQNYNRYSYCLNNPLKYTDPSGEFLTWSLNGNGISFGVNFTPVGIPLGCGFNVGFEDDISLGLYGEVGYRVGGTGFGSGIYIQESLDYNFGSHSWYATTTVGCYASLFMINAGVNCSHTYSFEKNEWKSGWSIGAGIGFGNDEIGTGFNVSYGSNGLSYGVGGYIYSNAWESNPDYDPDYWNNNNDVIRNNNCYSYMLDEPDRYLNDIYDINPGHASGIELSYPYNIKDVLNAAVSDGRVKKLNLFNMMGFGKKGYYSGYLVVADNDYHWYRQDKGGFWSSQHGHGGEVNQYDAKWLIKPKEFLQPIRNPRYADHNYIIANYTRGRMVWIRK